MQANIMAGNLDFDQKTQKLFWRINFKSIYSNLLNIMGFEMFGEPYLGKLLLCKGARSLKFDPEIFKIFFPNFVEEENLVLIKNASNFKILNLEHWVHFDNATGLVDEINKFLDLF
jgi:hypothetical protein